MRARSAAIAALVLAFVAAAGGAASGGTRHLPGTTCPVFPANNYWHADVRGLAVHPRSETWLSHMSPTRRLHPDFGPAYGAQPVPYGIPVTVVGGDHAKVTVSFEYGTESDHVGYPFGTDTRIEGGRAAGGDRHAIVVDRSTCRLYETWATFPQRGTRWTAGSGASGDLTSNRLRPQGWTSADAAGLPILPGLLRCGTRCWPVGSTTPSASPPTSPTQRATSGRPRHQAGSIATGPSPDGRPVPAQGLVPDPPTAPTPGPCCAP